MGDEAVNKSDLGIIDLSAVGRMDRRLGSQEGNNVTSVVLAHISKATMHSLEYLFCAMNCGDQREDVPDLVSSCKESTLWQGTR